MLLALGISALVGYLLGSVNFAVLVAKRHGIDILKEGSGNPGATNVKRVLGKGPGNLVFALDALKGAAGTYLPFLLADAVSPGAPRFEVLVAGLAGTLLGHCFSCFLGFKGGKGVASTIGGLLVLLPFPIVIGAALWAIAFYATRYVSVASLALGLSLPLSCWLLPKFTSLQFSDAELIFAGAIALFNVWTHRSNIGRLLRGEENKFTKKTS
ncbi:MAG: acyl-phosphate glycerol 3-phosphate acyltransferase [Verrucomicrobiota bacterium]